ncbi:MAG: helix-turn-helix domain-containing protein, partial [Thermoplasmata archaeon]
MPLNLDQLYELIRQGEDTQTEFRQELSKEALQRLSTNIAALANAEGGYIIFGVVDDK